MKVILATLALFLLAFAGLATGLILRRKGLRGGCSPSSGTGRDCRCNPATARESEAEVNGNASQDDRRETQETL